MGAWSARSKICYYKQGSSMKLAEKSGSHSRPVGCNTLLLKQKGVILLMSDPELNGLQMNKAIFFAC